MPAPNVPILLTSSLIVQKTFTLAWAIVTPASNVAGYKIYQNGVQIGTSTLNIFYVIGLQPSISYSLTVAAYNAAGQTSAQSTALIVHTLAPAAVILPPLIVPKPVAVAEIANVAATISYTAVVVPIPPTVRLFAPPVVVPSVMVNGNVIVNGDLNDQTRQLVKEIEDWYPQFSYIHNPGDGSYTIVTN